MQSLRHDYVTQGKQTKACHITPTLLLLMCERSTRSTRSNTKVLLLECLRLLLV